MEVSTLQTAESSKAAGDRGVQRLREATAKVMGSVFYGTLLKSMRESTLKGKYGHGGRGEEIFAEQLHGIWAEKLSGRMGQDLTSGLLKRLERQQRIISSQQAVVGGAK